MQHQQKREGSPCVRAHSRAKAVEGVFPSPTLSMCALGRAGSCRRGFQQSETSHSEEWVAESLSHQYWVARRMVGGDQGSKELCLRVNPD